MEKNEVVEISGSPSDLISLALNKGSDLEKLEKLLTLKERYEALEAKKAFVRAMTAFKTEAPRVTKDKNNKQYNSKYTSLDNLVNTVNPILSKHGLSSSWDIKQNGTIEVTCRITHELGHSETASASAPADVSGAKNAIQQIKSTITYLKAVTFESICGLASTDANLDDDGNGVSDLIDEKQISQILDFFTELEVKPTAFLKYMNVSVIEEIKKSDFNKAISSLENALKTKKAKAK